MHLYSGSAKDQRKQCAHISEGSTDVCTGHQTGFIDKINCVRTRQIITKHISIAYNMLY